MTKLDKYFLDGPLEQISFDAFGKFVKTFEYEKGKAAAEILIYHKGITNRSVMYNFMLAGLSMGYEEVKDHPSFSDFSLQIRLRCAGVSEFDSYVEDEEFREMIRDLCKKNQTDAFYVSDHKSDPDINNDNLMELFATYYFMKCERSDLITEKGMDIFSGSAEEVLRAALQKQDETSDEEVEDCTEEKIKIDG